MLHLCVQALKLTTEDVKEEFIRGSGRGGQAVNKTSNKVRLTHVPTGLKVVMCITCEWTATGVISVSVCRPACLSFSLTTTRTSILLVGRLVLNVCTHTQYVYVDIYIYMYVHLYVYHMCVSIYHTFTHACIHSSMHKGKVSYAWHLQSLFIHDCLSILTC